MSQHSSVAAMNRATRCLKACYSKDPWQGNAVPTSIRDNESQYFSARLSAPFLMPHLYELA
jgi:hypothetical protein